MFKPLEIYKLGKTETDLLNQVLDLAARTGWLAHHDRPARRSDGSYYTAIQGDAGFPDIVLAKNGRVLIRELKDNYSKPTPEQIEWLAMSGGKIWRPRDWDEIVKELTNHD